jgi:hypothetical protein
MTGDANQCKRPARPDIMEFDPYRSLGGKRRQRLSEEIEARRDDAPDPDGSSELTVAPRIL